ncbi:hypothetical protein M4951_14665 [Blastopirellula sp. J2-11]|uniref:hypothetical protein n=1 Tax=Blastopirellula sp. J2-11 TaxID=2943192 RepID=UPI0021C881CC|nr:hypothetical protein [Blastopirellula sp. J2-11]UUO04633.1 hypothetical protein M4951_14665 [Blastopirellula sp. J2-11]
MTKRYKQRHLKVKEAVGVAQSSRMVDRDAGVIRQVQICGPLSRNGRNYSQALDDAVSLYEGVKVNIDHGFAPGEERSFFAGFGVIRHAKRQGDAIYGDLHFLKSHELAELVCERAERFPETFGLSHDADIDGYVDGEGIFQVTKITAVRSVDLVGDPATARGIFESERTAMKKTISEWIESLDEAQYPARTSVLAKLEPIEIDGKSLLKRTAEASEKSPEAAIAVNFRALVIAALDADATSETIHAIWQAQELLKGSEVPSSDANVQESISKRLLASVRRIGERLDSLEREQWATAVLESAGLPNDSPLRAELCKLPSRAEMEAHVDAGDLGRSFTPIGGGEMPIWESTASQGERKVRTKEEMLAAWGVTSK